MIKLFTSFATVAVYTMYWNTFTEARRLLDSLNLLQGLQGIFNQKTI